VLEEASFLSPVIQTVTLRQDTASDWENAKNSAGRTPQTKTVRLPAGMALGYFLCPQLRASNYVSFARQNKGFPIDRNASSKPINSKHILLPSNSQSFALPTFLHLVPKIACTGQGSQGKFRIPRI
jgi:hypothetical protein